MPEKTKRKKKNSTSGRLNIFYVMNQSFGLATFQA